MSTYTKEKNFIVFNIDNHGICKFDINTCEFIGYNGKTVKNVPVGLTHYLNTMRYNGDICQVLYLLHYKRSVPYAELKNYTDFIQLADKVINIGYKGYFPVEDAFVDLSMVDCQNDKYSVGFKIANEHFKDFAKYLKENENKYYIFSEFATYYTAKSYSHYINEYFTEQDLQDMITYCKNPDNYALWAYYVAYSGIKEFTNNNHRKYLCKYFNEWMAEMNEIPKKNNNFFKEYVNAKSAYKNFKNKKKNAILATRNPVEKLFYENDKFTVVIPHSVAEFHAEATAQQNCVERIYMDYVIDGYTNVVFIRKKDDINKSYITCEVKHDGSISQYLAQYNNDVTDEDAMAFYREYKKFLKKSFS